MQEKRVFLLKTRNGAFWDALEADLSKDPIPCCPHGGGFLHNIPRADFVDFDATPPRDLRLVTVGLGDDAVCRAYVDFHDRWNGWLCPSVDRENLDRFLDKLAQWSREGAEVSTGWLEGQTLVMQDPSQPGAEPERIEPYPLDFEGRSVQVWDVSLGLTWEHVGGPFRSGLDPMVLAREFCRLLRRELGPGHLTELVMRNAAETRPGVCHSHDFCDANLVMAQAFLIYDVDAAADMGNAEQARLWDEAWALARGAGFLL